MSQRKVPAPFIHIIIIIVFICYEVSVVYLLGVRIGFWYFLPFYVPDLLFFYATTYIVLPMFLHRKLSMVALISLMLITHFSIFSFLDFSIRSSISLPFTAKEIYVRAAYRSIYILGISLAIWAGRNYIIQLRLNLELKMAQLQQRNKEIELENIALRARVDSHLLFNTLNFVHVHITERQPREAKAIALLSEIMRSSLENTEPYGKIPLKHELESIGSYIELNRLLNKGKFYVNVDIAYTTISKGFFIPPVLLVDFVQDMFKHGMLNEQDNPAVIIVYCNKNELNFKLNNAIGFNNNNAPGLGIGLANTKQRLKQHYGENFQLYTQKNETHYLVDLKIIL